MTILGGKRVLRGFPKVGVEVGQFGPLVLGSGPNFDGIGIESNRNHLSMGSERTSGGRDQPSSVSLNAMGASFSSRNENRHQSFGLRITSNVYHIFQYSVSPTDLDLRQ